MPQPQYCMSRTRNTDPQVSTACATPGHLVAGGITPLVVVVVVVDFGHLEGESGSTVCTLPYLTTSKPHKQYRPLGRHCLCRFSIVEVLGA